MLSYTKKLRSFGVALRESQYPINRYLSFVFAFPILQFCVFLTWCQQNYFETSESLNHLVYWYNLLGKSLQSKYPQLAKLVYIRALRTAESSYRVASKVKKTPFHALRAKTVIHMSLGNWPQALACCIEYTSEDSFIGGMGDMFAKAALCSIRVGEFPEAGIYLETALLAIQQAVLEMPNDNTIKIWYCKALLVQADYALQFGNLALASSVAYDAQEIAATYNLPHVLIETTEFIKKNSL